MKLKSLLLGSLGLAMATGPAFADGSDLSFAVHDVLITQYTNTINLTVRNVANSTDPAQRDLRLVSADPVIDIAGQVWCNSYNHADTGAIRADMRLGEVTIVSAPGGGAIPFELGPSAIATQNYNGQDTLENFAFSQSIDLPDSWDSEAAITLDYLNPVQVVEARLEHFLENSAGTAADFLRQDDVFEVEIDVSVVGWCHYESDNLDNDYAGARWVTVTAAIFYQGDDDIQDVIQTVGGADSVNAPVPSRARDTATTRGSSATPPARNSRPAPARVGTVSGDRAGDDDNEAALLLPAVQSVREAARPRRSGDNKQQAGRGRTQGRASGDAARTRAGVEPDEIDAPAQAGVEPDEIDAPARAASRDRSDAPLDYLPINTTAQANAGVEPDEIDNRVAQEADAEPQDAF